jgi:hypothetical protein
MSFKGGLVMKAKILVATVALGLLPAALPIFATGLGVLGLIRWRSKRALP